MMYTLEASEPANPAKRKAPIMVKGELSYNNNLYLVEEIQKNLCVSCFFEQASF